MLFEGWWRAPGEGGPLKNKHCTRAGTAECWRKFSNGLCSQHKSPNSPGSMLPHVQKGSHPARCRTGTGTRQLLPMRVPHGYLACSSRAPQIHPAGQGNHCLFLCPEMLGGIEGLHSMEQETESRHRKSQVVLCPSLGLWGPLGTSAWTGKRACPWLLPGL